MINWWGTLIYHLSPKMVKLSKTQIKEKSKNLQRNFMSPQLCAHVEVPDPLVGNHWTKSPKLTSYNSIISHRGPFFRCMKTFTFNTLNTSDNNFALLLM